MVSEHARNGRAWERRNTSDERKKEKKKRKEMRARKERKSNGISKSGEKKKHSQPFGETNKQTDAFNARPRMQQQTTVQKLFFYVRVARNFRLLRS